MSRPIRTEGEPNDPLTEMARVGLDAVQAKWPEAKVIVMVDVADRGGLAIGGYDSDMDAFVNMYLHLRAIAQANGKDMDLVAIGRG